MSVVTESETDFNGIIEDLQQEAQISIELIRELAGLEGYIAETYAQRCLAELFQNSDDSISSDIAILRLGGCLVYANNGRIFNESDFRSLCKSASSSKERGKSIGYRGIGFKSVVNICSNVIIASGSLRCSFDRDRTANLLGCFSAVPLVRVPHHLAPSERSLCGEVMERLPGYSTFFIFSGLNDEALNQELSGLSPEHFLFLRNLLNISIDLVDQKSILSLGIERFTPATSSQGDLTVTSVAISSDFHSSHHEWIVAANNDVSVAVRSIDGIPSRVLKQEALLHAYLPTQAISCLGARVNADFSTDPSRTRLKYDLKTDEAIENVASLISALIHEFSCTPDSLFWRSFVDCLIPYSEYKVLELQGNKFCSSLLKKLYSDASEVRQSMSSILRLLPNAYKDIESVGSKLPASLNVFLPIAASYSDAKRFLEIIGSKPLPLEQVLEFHSLQENAIDLRACHFFLRNVVNEGASAERLMAVYSLVSADGRVVCASDVVQNAIVLSGEFLVNLADVFLSQRRVQELLEDLGLTRVHFGSSFDKTSGGIDVSSLTKSLPAAAEDNRPISGVPSPSTFRVLDEESKRRYGVQNWRLSEEVVAYYYRSQGYKVIDVSQANKGYDLEVLGDSLRLCVEVKDIKDTIKGFCLTQNEYTEADMLGESYVLALVRRGDSDSLDIMFVSNPGSTFQAFTTKRAKAYEFLVSGFKYSPNVSFS